MATRRGDPGERRRGPLRSAVRSNIVSPVRRCSRTACGRPAVATLTYVYADSTAVLGPLATYAEPHCYDLCAEHSERLTAPRGWEVVRLAVEGHATTGPTSGDDLEALADAVREAARPPAPGSHRARDPRRGVPGQPPPHGGGADPIDVARRAHLRILRSPEP
ncbi:DUF3499 domain-containing protein [Streptomyces sp. 4N509B]|uniref:DUF3499 domain-containing protein n=1 Tax=Streptomyces sp. 4N509B TaxID=3457413 RepID=UPI003FCFB529